MKKGAEKWFTKTLGTGSGKDGEVFSAYHNNMVEREYKAGKEVFTAVCRPHAE